MIRFHLFGCIDLRDDAGVEIRSILSQPKRTALLAYLAADPGEFTRRRTLLGVFWPELEETRARNALSKAIHHLRRSLESDAVVGRGDEELGLAGDRVWCDVVAFSTALKDDPQRALDLYSRGPFLEEFVLPGAPEFEHWLDGRRVLLQRQALDAAGRALEAALQEKDAAMAVSFARRAMEIDPYDEALLRQLLVLLDGDGDRAGAIAAYQDFEARLARDLQIAPAPETEALVSEIRSRSEPAFTSAKEPIAPVMTEAPRSETPDRGDDLGEPASSTPAPEFADLAPRPGTPRWRRRGAWWVVSVAALATVGLALAVLDRAVPPAISGLSPEALVYYQRGEAYVRAGNGGDRGANFRLALEMFQHASELSPWSAAGHAAVAVAHLRLFHYGYDRSTERQVMARKAIDEGARLDPDDPEVNRALAWYHLWAERDYARALEAGQRVLEASPGDVEALTLVFAANRRLGRVQEALPAVQELVRVDEGVVAYRSEWVTTLIGLREYERALRVLDEALTLFPTKSTLHYQKWLTTLRATGDPAAGARVLEETSARLGSEATWPWEFQQLWLARRYDEALDMLEREQPETFSTQQGELPVDLRYGLVESLAGEEQAARQSYARSAERLQAMLLTRPDEPWFHGWLAVALAGSGDKAAALAQVDIAVALADLEPDLWENPYMMQEVVLPTYIMAGEHDKAIELMAELLDSRHYRAISRAWIRMDPRFDPLRPHPRWSEVSGENVEGVGTRSP